ncbi:MAG: hypothetical protein AAFO79_00165 [Pseudomonadota bacterium]
MDEQIKTVRLPVELVRGPGDVIKAGDPVELPAAEADALLAKFGEARAASVPTGQLQAQFDKLRAERDAALAASGQANTQWEQVANDLAAKNRALEAKLEALQRDAEPDVNRDANITVEPIDQKTNHPPAAAAAGKASRSRTQPRAARS